MIRTIVFDFGNVVAFFDHRRASRRLAEHSDLAPDDLHVRLFGSQLDIDYDSGRLTTPTFVRVARAVCRLRCTDDEFVRAYSDIFWPNPEVAALLPRLRPAYRLLLLSNTNELHARQFRPQFRDALAHFDHLVLSYEFGARKPAPAIYDHTRRLAGCAAEECVFIDDLPPNVEGARARGWPGIRYTDAEALRRELAELGVRV